MDRAEHSAGDDRVRRACPGIRLLPAGTLYTSSGSDAVEFTLRDGTRFFVGADQQRGKFRPRLQHSLFFRYRFTS
ncbi:hypothetical protein [Gemmatimonas sp.]|uniref:hypothetical protein n=1 Tax=Gemmatimonas sp. TaxID=1962908 RepID=UPI00356B532B